MFAKFKLNRPGAYCYVNPLHVTEFGDAVEGGTYYCTTSSAEESVLSCSPEEFERGLLLAAADINPGNLLSR